MPLWDEPLGLVVTFASTLEADFAVIFRGAAARWTFDHAFSDKSTSSVWKKEIAD
jgi:hypothetical protein